MPDAFYEFMARNGRRIGIGFSLVVIALLLYAHLLAPIWTPFTAPLEQRPKVGLCHDAPEHAVQELRAVVDFGRERGLDPTQVWYQPLNCTEIRTFKDEDGQVRSTYFSEGWILITLRDQWFDKDHVGETVRWTRTDGEGRKHNVAATILLPREILVSQRIDEFAEEPPTRILPPNPERLVLAHEYVHAWGFDHTVTGLFWPFYMEKSGHLMTRNVRDSGWSAEGIHLPEDRDTSPVP